ncbi:MMPL family transporter [Sinomonas sp. P47F7]|uniref:MMPL family transporter n=1 Tax=Sinomonas sp. P47F7 TaxID=3410987 RepID=UPI003BF4863E
MNRVTRFSIARPWTVIVGWIIIFLVSAAGAIQLDGALSAGGFTNPRAEALTTQADVEKAFGDQPNQIIVAVDSKTAQDAGSLAPLVTVLQDAGASTITGPSQNPKFLSADRKTAVIVAGFGGDNTAVQNKVPDLQRSLSGKIADASVYVTGQPALDYQLNVHSKEDATRAEMIVFPFLIVVLLLVFRSVVATLVPLLMAGTALAVASALGFVATRFTDISILYSNIVSMIGLAVAVDYSLFIIKRYRDELAAGKDAVAALETATKTAGRSVVFSGIAVAVALVALFIPNVMAFTSIALGGVLVTLVAIGLSVTVLPAGLKLLGGRINWGTIRLPSGRGRQDAAKGGRRTLAGGRRPALVGLLGVAAMLLAAVPVLSISLQSPVASATVLPSGDPAREGLTVIDRNIGHEGLFPIQIVVSAPAGTSTQDVAERVESLTASAKAKAGVAAVTSVTSTGASPAQVQAALGNPQTAAGFKGLWSEQNGRTTARILVDTVEGPDSVRAHELVKEFRADGEAAPAPFTVHVTGATAQGVDFDETLVGSIPLIAGLVVVLTFVMLAFAFRSFLLPLLALFFNSLVVLASLGLLTGLLSLGGSAPLNSVTPILLFAVMFGLSMDYMVIIMSRIVEAYRSGSDFHVAVTTGVRATRSMINSAAIIMVAVFVSFSSAQISIVREIGFGLAIAVILDALVVRMFIMPAILRAAGPRVLGRASAGHGSDVPREAAAVEAADLPTHDGAPAPESAGVR